VNIYPPGTSFQADTAEEVWETARQWVSTNRSLIREIASPYRRYMASDHEDLQQEAIIAAFMALNVSRTKNKPEALPRFFRVIFSSNCMKLAYGIRSESILEEHEFIWPEHEDEYEPDKEMIEEALKVASDSHRAICLWLLEQPWPTSTKDVARHFKVSRRYVREAISSVVKQISIEGQ
jgi:DNA-directed RNA polymerase specialized sigma24 family protein